ncbi:hypothetical protein CAPTEDRAFT_121614 [Capitella teleta]|uniref:Activator of basal transcription 1 n=1 Tax=Capitella teleta TaxID=283909 RepID=R7VBT3_CAPTE|nr:hypothetical protein CAPTEDRAFT_121614 [Capitella teleta]|eukprot:ELU16022.1 hypothetical protein CAPTEDRAFT_121614 [Capitella teleta]
MAESEESTPPRESPKKTPKAKKKEKEPGIIYLSRIPTMMTINVVRRIFSDYGELDRIFLQPDDKAPAHKKMRSFTEGWVEFLDKRRAKLVATLLNGQEIKCKKSNPWHSEIWNIKYLPKFKWGHLSERLAYERAVHQQRLRTEITQAKKEANFFIQNVERNKAKKRREKREADDEEESETAKKFKEIDRDWTYRQRETEKEILTAKKQKTKGSKKGKKATPRTGEVGPKALASNKSFLKTLFSGGSKDD